MSPQASLTRRDFFTVVGAGIAVFMGCGAPPAASQNRTNVYPEDFNAYLLIGADGRVQIFSGKIEMGQGVMTSQAQMAAEELGVELEAIDMVLGDTERCPWDGGTFGSLTTRMFGPALRAAAAEARAVLMTLAAERLAVPKERLIVRSGIVSIADDPGRRVSYGELARGRRIARTLSEKAVLRAAADFRVMGRSPARIDARDKVTGAAQYAADIRRPGMLYARILRPPVHGAALLKADTAAAAALPGVTVIRNKDLIAALHADPESAAAALAKIKAEWSKPASDLDPENIFGRIVAAGPELKVILQRGEIETDHAASRRPYVSTYRKGYVAHAPMEPHAALADPTPEQITVWASTQTPFPTRDRIAATLGLDPRKVRVITPFLGGGFGGKSADRQALEAAQLAQLCGKPVQVAWDRAEEFFYDRFDPACVVTLNSALDETGRISLWDFSVYGTSERGAAHVYDIDNLRIRAGGGPTYGQPDASPSAHPFETGPWRAPGANMNVFAIESQMDIMAASAGVDPLEFRLRHLSDARMRRVLQAAANRFGWKPAASPSGRGVGIACSTDAGTYVAAMAEVAVDRAHGAVRVRRIVCAEDLGLVVNPTGARMQIEGGITMGLGYSLSEELNFRGSEIMDRNFSSYHLPRFSAVPHIETVLVDNDALAPQGGGEPPITIMGAVLANAIHDATGARLMRLPMTPQRILAAMPAAKKQPFKR